MLQNLTMTQKLICLALAGAVGTLARFGLSGWVQRITPGTFPIGTFVVNMVGCFAFGLIWSALENRLGAASELRLIVLTGFMGAFTTFSSFMFETGALIEDGRWLWMAGNLIGQNAIGLVCLFLGHGLGRVI